MLRQDKLEKLYAYYEQFEATGEISNEFFRFIIDILSQHKNELKFLQLKSTQYRKDISTFEKRLKVLEEKINKQ